MKPEVKPPEKGEARGAASDKRLISHEDTVQYPEVVLVFADLLYHAPPPTNINVELSFLLPSTLHMPGLLVATNSVDTSYGVWWLKAY